MTATMSTLQKRRLSRKVCRIVGGKYTVGEAGPPYCMRCCGFGNHPPERFEKPWIRYVACKECNGTGLSKDHPAFRAAIDQTTKGGA